MLLITFTWDWTQMKLTVTQMLRYSAYQMLLNRLTQEFAAGAYRADCGAGGEGQSAAETAD